ncbi:MAG: vWA domain-containing protein [Crocinitomicaceae bacterium]
MSFVYPGFLWALFALLIPIIVHLFNFRRYKTVYFPSVKYLEEAVEDSKSGTKLKHLLVLLSRLLALTCLIFAFAQPYLPSGEGEATENLTSIYIDNSYSMQAEGLDGDLLNEVKNQALEIIDGLEENERINLLTADLESIHQRFYSKAEIKDMIKAVNYSAQSTPLVNILRLQNDLFNDVEEKGNRRIILLSDFQNMVSNISELDMPEIPTYFYKATANNPENISIDSVWFESPVHRVNTPVEAHIRVKNQSNQDVEDLSIRLSIDGQQPAPKRISVAANTHADAVITFTDKTSGIKKGQAEIKTNQLYFDDTYFFSYTIKEKVDILLVSGTDTTNNFSQLYGLDPYYNAYSTKIENVTAEDFEGKELVILHNVIRIPGGIQDLLKKTLDNGGSIGLIPGAEADLNSWNTFLSTENLPTLKKRDSSRIQLNYFNSDDPLYNGVFESSPSNFKTPEVYGGCSFNIQGRQDFITVFGANQQRPFMVYQKDGSARVFLCSAPFLDKYTNFHKHSLFAATFLRVAETASFEKPLSMTIGKMLNYPLQKPVDEKHVVHLKNDKYQTDIIPQVLTNNGNQSISFNQLENSIAVSGFYHLSNDFDFEDVIGLNYDRAESSIQTYSEEELLNQFASIGWNKAEAFTTGDKGTVQINQLKVTEYWRILLILGLIFIAIEILLLKLWKS